MDAGTTGRVVLRAAGDDSPSLDKSEGCRVVLQNKSHNCRALDRLGFDWLEVRCGERELRSHRSIVIDNNKLTGWAILSV